METLLASGILTIAVSVIGGLLKTAITNLSNSLKLNTEAISRLTADYRVHDTQLINLKSTLTEHQEIHKKFDTSIEELSKNLGDVKSDVKVLLDRGGDNGHTSHSRK